MFSGSDELNVLQLLDSAFPIGSFAHSGGLEASLKIMDANMLDTCQKAKMPKEIISRLQHQIICILENAGTFQVPFLRKAYFSCEDTEELCIADKEMHVMMSNHVAKRASLQQGRSLASVSAVVYSKHQNRDKFTTLDGEICANKLNGHLAVVFGAVCCYLGVPLFQAAQYFLFGQLRSLIGSAVRMGILGPVKGQELQNDLQKNVTLLAEQCLTIETAYVSNPVVECAQNAHDKLFSKLFYS